MKAAYLLNNHIIFDSTRSELHVNQQVTVLQELENTLLTLFVTQPEEIISKEALFTAGWKGRYASDNSLNRVISTLRTKLGDSSKSPQFIKTIPKKGYSFIAPVSETEIPDIDIVEEADKLDTSPSAPQRIKPSKLLKHAVLLVSITLLITLISTIFLPSHNTSETKISKITSITQLPGNEILPSISPSGQYVAFSHQESASSFYSLKVKPLHGPSRNLVESDNFHALSPVWESGNKALLYVRSGPRLCEIRKVGINLQLELISDILITKCNTDNVPISVAWGATEDVIYFTDVKGNSNHQSIFMYNLLSSQKTQIASPGEIVINTGFYYVTFNKVTNHLIALSSKKTHTTTISIFDTKHKVIAKRLVKRELKQVTSFNKLVAFLTQNNQINALDPVTSKETVLMSPQTISIKYPFFNNKNQTQLAFVSGELQQKLMVKRDSDGMEQEVNNQRQAMESSPTFDANNNLYFLSNRSGVEQVWKKSAEGELTQITQFTTSIPFYSLTLSPNAKFLALDSRDGVLIYNLHTINYQPAPLITLSGASTPIFSSNSQLLVTKYLNGTNVLLPYDLRSEEFEVTVAENVVFGFKHPNYEHIFFTQKHVGGLWAQDAEGIKKIFNSAEISNANKLQLTKNGFIFADQKHSLWHYNLDAGSASNFGKMSPGEQFAYHEQSSNFIFTKVLLGNTNIHIAELE